MAHERDRSAAKATEPADDGLVIGERAVAVELDEVIEHPLDVIECVGPIRMAGELDLFPDFVSARLGFDSIDLALETRHLARHADSPQKRKLTQSGKPLTQLQLFDGALGPLSGHRVRTALAVGRGKGGARPEG